MDKHTENLQRKLENGQTSIGIDIGTNSVNVVQMALYKGKMTVIKAIIQDIRTDDKKQDRDHATLIALHSVMDQFVTKKAKVACVVNCPQTCVRRVISPIMPKSELTSALLLDVKQSIPFSIDDAVIDYNIIDEVKDKGVQKYAVVVAASPKETITRLISFFRAKKLKPFSGFEKVNENSEENLDPLNLKIKAFLPLSLCLENVIEESELRVDETLVTIEIGTLITELNIFKNAKLQFSRKIPFAGSDITKSMTGALMTDKGRVELTLEDAERIKREFGIPQKGSTEVFEGKVPAAHLIALIRPKIEQLVNEIERSFDFYREQMHGGKVDRIVLFGGGAQLKGLPEYLNDELGTEVSIGNPLADINLLSDEIISTAQDAQRLVLAIGVALSGMKGINLLPVEYKELRKNFIEKLSFRLLIVFFVIIFGIAFFSIRTQMTINQKRLNDLNAGYFLMEPELEEIRNTLIINDLRNRQILWANIYQQLSEAVSDRMYLTEISNEDQVINIRGMIVDENNDAESELAYFMKSLDKKALKNIILTKSNRIMGIQPKLEFLIKADVK